MTLDLFNILAGAVGIVAFVFAIWEHYRHRAERIADEERAKAMEARNRSALRMAVAGAQTADLIVQRAKDEDSSKAELQNIARALRGIMLTLGAELEDQQKVSKAYRFGRAATRSSGRETSPPDHREANVKSEPVEEETSSTSARPGTTS
jgi:hypothetical protein